MYSIGANRRKISNCYNYNPHQFSMFTDVPIPDYDLPPADYDEDDDDEPAQMVQSPPVQQQQQQPQRRVTESAATGGLYYNDAQILDYQTQNYAAAQKQSARQRSSIAVVPQQPPQQRSSAATPQRTSIVVKPPDRLKETIELNTSKAASSQQTQAKMPKKHHRSTTHIGKEMLGALERLANEQYAQQVRHSSSMSAAMSAGGRSVSTFDPRPITFGIRPTPQPYDGVPSHKKSEMDEYYAGIKSRNQLQKVPRRPDRGSLSSNDLGSTLSSAASMPNSFSDQNLSAMAMGASGEWSLRWSITDVGRSPGQLRSPKGLCILRDSGNVVVADSKNGRLQVFSGSSGKLIAILGESSPDQRTAASFTKESRRVMEPSGLCETSDGSLLVVADLNRLLYIEAASKHGVLYGELAISGKTQLSGVAVTHENKIILTEVGSRPTAELYENNGLLIRSFKGEFRTPTHVAWNEEYHVAAVSDGEQQCVLIYDASGKLLNKFGRIPAGSGSIPGSGIVDTPLDYPAGVCWLDGSRLLVADRAQDSVVCIDVRNFSVEDVLLKADGLSHPVAMATNRRNRIVLTEELYDFGVNKFAAKMFRLMETAYRQF